MREVNLPNVPSVIHAVKGGQTPNSVIYRWLMILDEGFSTLASGKLDSHETNLLTLLESECNIPISFLPKSLKDTLFTKEKTNVPWSVIGEWAYQWVKRQQKIWLYGSAK